MKLRIYASVMTYILAATMVGLGMWYGTNCDVLEILVVNVLFTPFAGIAVMAATEQKPEEKRECKIYTLSGGNFYAERYK